MSSSKLFLEDSDGRLVTIDGTPVIMKTLTEKRKPSDCQQCGFSKWCLGDTSYVITNRNDGGIQWLRRLATSKGHSKANAKAASRKLANVGLEKIF